MRILPLVAALATTASAQGILPLDSTYRFASLGNEFAACALAGVPDVQAAEGQLTFALDGELSGSGTCYLTCAGDTEILAEAIAGAYQVGTDGRLTIDGFPTLFGLESESLNLRCDMSVAIATREDPGATDNPLTIAIALSSGQSDATLSGTYAMVRLVQRYDINGFSMRSDAGLIVFDGAGSYTESGDQHFLSFGGSAVTGPYTVAADGSLSVIEGAGAVSADGEVFFWLRIDDAEAELTVGVRKRPANDYQAPLMSGLWSTIAMETLVGSGVNIDGPFLNSLSGAFEFVPLATDSGTVSSTEFACQTSPISSLCGVTQDSGGYVLSADGTLAYGTVTGTVSADGSFFVAPAFDPDGAGLVLGVSRCSWPVPIGHPTPGSGGFAPGITPVGGFPYAGNSGFGLVMTSGLGGAPAVLVLSLGEADPGLLLLGGTVWIDPLQVLGGVPLVLSGPGGVPGVGAAGLLLPIPDDPTLGGLGLFVQGAVLDPGAPEGFALTRGLGIFLGR